MTKKTILSIALAVMLTFVLAIGVAADTGSAVTIATSQPANGDLVGASGGAFWFANISYPGNDTALTLKLSFAPADPVTLRGVGFNLYAADGSLVGSGLLTGAGLKTLEYSSADAGQFLMQVYNYNEGTQVWFTVTAEGLPAEAAAAEETQEPEAAAEVEEPAAEAEEAEEMAPMQGVLTGNAGGSFTRFTVSYSSDDQVTLDMFYTPADNLIAQAVDLNIYGPDGEVALDAAKVDNNGKLEAVFTPEAGVKYLIVVSNYVPDLMLSYNIASSVVPASVTIGS